MKRVGQELWFNAPGVVEILSRAVPAPGPGQILVQGLFSLISAGTEMMYFQGQVPSGCLGDTGIESLKGLASYPFRYGYCAVGRVLEVGVPASDSPPSPPAFVAPGDLVFCFHPHGDLFVCCSQDAVVLPAGMDPLDGLFFANMETALMLVLDLAPRLGERIKVYGLGTLGLLCALVLRTFPLAQLSLEDPRTDRRDRAREWGLGPSLEVQDKSPLDGALEISGSPLAFNQAVEQLAFSGRLVLGSWYGNKSGAPAWGGSFHRKRLTVLGSQVSTFDPSLTGRWSKERLAALTLDWLARLHPSRLITHRFPLSQGAQAYGLLSQEAPGTGAVIFEY